MLLCEFSSLCRRKSFLPANLKPCCYLRQVNELGSRAMWMWVGARLAWGPGV